MLVMVLNDDNYLVYAMHHYQAPSCRTVEEFESDLKTLTYIKKHINKHPIKTKLLLNHIIILFNCFGPAALHLLLYKIDRANWGTLSTFLLYLHQVPEYLPEYDYRITDLPLNEQVIKDLREL